MPDVDEEDAGLAKLKEGLLSVLFMLFDVAPLSGLELSAFEDAGVIVPNGEAVLLNAVGPLCFPNVDGVVPNPPVVPNAGVALLGFVPKDGVVVLLEVPGPNTEPAFAFTPNGEVAVVVPPLIPNAVLVVVSLTAAVVPAPLLVPKVDPKANFGADTPLDPDVLDIFVAVGPVVVVDGLKLNI